MFKLSVSCMPRLITVLVCSDNAHMVDIIDTGENLEAWLYHRDYGEKYLMFGIPQSSSEHLNFAVKGFIYMIENAVNRGDYIAQYDKVGVYESFRFSR